MSSEYDSHFNLGYDLWMARIRSRISFNHGFLLGFMRLLLWVVFVTLAQLLIAQRHQFLSLGVCVFACKALDRFSSYLVDNRVSSFYFHKPWHSNYVLGDVFETILPLTTTLFNAKQYEQCALLFLCCWHIQHAQVLVVGKSDCDPFIIFYQASNSRL